MAKKSKPRFTIAAHKIITSSIEEAKTFGLDYVGVEHLMLAFLADKEFSESAKLSEFGLNYDSFRELLRYKPSHGQGPKAYPINKNQFTPRVYQIFSHSGTLAREEGFKGVDEITLFWALLLEKEGVHAFLLRDLQIKIPSLIQSLRKQIREQKSDVIKPIEIVVDVGTAPPALIAEILSDFSAIYKLRGGSGITFSPKGVTRLEIA